MSDASARPCSTSVPLTDSPAARCISPASPIAGDGIPIDEHLFEPNNAPRSQLQPGAGNKDLNPELNPLRDTSRQHHLAQPSGESQVPDKGLPSLRLFLLVCVLLGAFVIALIVTQGSDESEVVGADTPVDAGPIVADAIPVVVLQPEKSGFTIVDTVCHYSIVDAGFSGKDAGTSSKIEVAIRFNYRTDGPFLDRSAPVFAQVVAYSDTKVETHREVSARLVLPQDPLTIETKEMSWDTDSTFVRTILVTLLTRESRKGVVAYRPISSEKKIVFPEECIR